MKRNGKEFATYIEKLQRKYDLAVVELLRKHNIKDYDNVEVEEQSVYDNNELKEIRCSLKYKDNKLGYIDFKLTPIEKNEVIL